MSNLPKFNIRESGRELPYYKKIVRLKNGKYIEVENPLFFWAEKPITRYILQSRILGYL